MIFIMRLHETHAAHVVMVVMSQQSCYSVLAVSCHVLGGASPLGAWVHVGCYIVPINRFFFFSAHQLGGWAGGRQASEVAVVNMVNEVWERGEIVMCIAVPDKCILVESNQIIKYLSPSNSQTEALKQKSFSLSCSINWLAIFDGSGLLGLLHPRALDGVL